MAKDQQQRSAETAEKRKELEEKELRHRVRPGTRAKLEELMQWHSFDVKDEAIQIMIMNLHALDPEGSAYAFQVPRHEIAVSKKSSARVRTVQISNAPAVQV